MRVLRLRVSSSSSFFDAVMSVVLLSWLYYLKMPSKGRNML
jgi:hypothetical protein